MCGRYIVRIVGPPLATIPNDNVVPPASRLDEVLGLLRAEGFAPDSPDTLRRSALEDGQFRGRIDDVRVDVFVPAIEFYASLNERKRRVTLLDHPICVLGPEDLSHASFA